MYVPIRLLQMAGPIQTAYSKLCIIKPGRSRLLEFEKKNIVLVIYTSLPNNRVGPFNRVCDRFFRNQ